MIVLAVRHNIQVKMPMNYVLDGQTLGADKQMVGIVRRPVNLYVRSGLKGSREPMNTDRSC